MLSSYKSDFQINNSKNYTNNCFLLLIYFILRDIQQMITI